MAWTASAIILAIVINIWLALALVVPAAVAVSINSYLRNSTEFEHTDDSYYGKQSLYILSLKAYRGIYEKDTAGVAHELLQNVWNHEVALKKIGKKHDSCRDHYETGCETCSERLSLIEQLVEAQHIPGTDDNDVERAHNLLLSKKEVKELM
jgi:hypothetical protein